MSVGIAAIRSSIPDTTRAIDDLTELRALSPVEAQTLRNLGINEIAFAPDSDATELARTAASSTLAAAGIEPRDIRTLLVIPPRVPSFFMASEATRLQAAVGMSGAATLSVGDLGCVSSSAALVTARALLEADASRGPILVAHGSKAPTPRYYRHPVTVNGEGGIAFLVTQSGGHEMLDIELETDGSYWDLFRVAYRNIPESQWFEECTSAKDYSFRLAIESRNRFARINERLLSRAGVASGDVDHYVMQNLSLGAYRFYEEFFDITFAKACSSNLQRYGHLGSADIILNLHTGVATGEFSPGDLVLVMNNSPVAAWSSMLVRV